MIATGLDRLLQDPGELAGRRYGLLAHGASVTAGCVPAHLALAAGGARRLGGPDRGRGVGVVAAADVLQIDDQQVETCERLGAR